MLNQRDLYNVAQEMNGLGLRATPDEVFFAVVHSNDDHFEITALDTIKLPEFQEPPAQLAHLRQTLLDLSKEYKIGSAGIKLIEGNARKKDSFRLNAEGVIQECFASSFVGQYVCCTIPRITGILGLTDKKQVKRWIEGECCYELAKWPEYKREQREAILAAIASLLCKSERQ